MPIGEDPCRSPIAAMRPGGGPRVRNAAPPSVAHDAGTAIFIAGLSITVGRQEEVITLGLGVSAPCVRVTPGPGRSSPGLVRSLTMACTTTGRGRKGTRLATCGLTLVSRVEIGCGTSVPAGITGGPPTASTSNGTRISNE